MVNKVKKRRMSGGKAIKQKDIAVFTRQLSTMMRAGCAPDPVVRHRGAGQHETRR
jgi:type II secretory pathway component PulF